MQTNSECSPCKKMNKEMAIEIICGLARRSASIDGSAGKKMDVDIVPDMALNAITLR
jgi:hypothetical protein